MCPFPDFKVPHYEPEEQSFRDWLKSNREILLKYDSDELVNLARSCGFNLDIIYRVLSDFKDAVRGSSIDNRAMMYAWQVEYATQEVSKMKEDLANPKFDLSPYWNELVKNNVTGD